MWVTKSSTSGTFIAYSIYVDDNALDGGCGSGECPNNSVKVNNRKITLQY